MGIPNDDMYGAAYDPVQCGWPVPMQFNAVCGRLPLQQVDMGRQLHRRYLRSSDSSCDTGIFGGFWISEGVVAGQATLVAVCRAIRATRFCLRAL
jgi:hypothetical protein